MGFLEALQKLAVLIINKSKERFIYIFILYNKEILGGKISNTKIAQIMHFLLCVNSRRINLICGYNGKFFDLEIQILGRFASIFANKQNKHHARGQFNKAVF